MIICTYKLEKDLLILSFKNIEKDVEFSEIDLILKEKYKIFLNQEKVNKIFSLMLEIDGTLKTFIDNENSFDWKIPLPLNTSATRFSQLLPMIFKDITLDIILKNYQKDGSLWLQQDKERILADDMGLGKTLQTIKALTEKYYRLEIMKFLIVCPSTLIENWRREFSKWTPYVNVYYPKKDDFGSKKDLFNNIKKNNGIVINYEQLINFNKNFNLDKIYFDVLIADEAHRLRKTSSINHKEFCRIKSNYTWLITGTPFERNREDIEGVLKALSPKNASIYNSKATDFILKVGLEERMLRRMKKDVLGELPNVTKKIEIIEMHVEQKNEYNKCVKELSLAKFEEKVGYIPRLLSISTMAESGVSSKIDRTVEIIKDVLSKKKKVVVFSYINKPLEKLNMVLRSEAIKSKLFTGSVDKIERAKIISDFQDKSKINVLLCNGKVAGEGITLTEASTVIFINEAWNPSSNRQAEDRVNRIGQKENVQIYYLRSSHSIDEDLERILKIKGKDELDFIKQI